MRSFFNCLTVFYCFWAITGAAEKKNCGPEHHGAQEKWRQYELPKISSEQKPTKLHHATCAQPDKQSGGNTGHAQCFGG